MTSAAAVFPETRYGNEFADLLEATTDALETALGSWEGAAKARGLALVERNRETLAKNVVVPAGDALMDLAERLTPNPARTPAGTLAIILDGIDRIDQISLARALAHVNRREAFGIDEGPPTDEQWASANADGKLALIKAAASLKAALREATKNG